MRDLLYLPGIECGSSPTNGFGKDSLSLDIYTTQVVELIVNLFTFNNDSINNMKYFYLERTPILSVIHRKFRKLNRVKHSNLIENVFSIAVPKEYSGYTERKA